MFHMYLVGLKVLQCGSTANKLACNDWIGTLSDAYKGAGTHCFDNALHRDCQQASEQAKEGGREGERGGERWSKA